MTMNIEKLKRTSRLFSAASLMIIAALLIAMVAVIELGMAVAFSDDIMRMIAEGAEPAVSIVKNDVYIVVAIACVCIPLVAAMFFLAYRLFRNIGGSHTPFDAENVKILKLISYLLMIIAIPVSIIASSVLIMYTSWSDGNIAWGGFGLVIVAVMFYFMAHIFEYGAALQKESDETL
jgi:magnesium-transporting ATPase (P-type)